MNSIRGKRFFTSWSGGKDCCLSLYYALQHGAVPHSLLTMFTEDGSRTRAHGLAYEIIKAQAGALSVPIATYNTSWDDYEDIYLEALSSLKNEGVTAGVFGDIDLEPHREWVEKVCGISGIKPYLPLWKKPRQDLLNEFLALGFVAKIVAVKEDVLDSSLLGQDLDSRTITELERAGVDISGEEGEYHSVVTAGPIFSEALTVQHGDIIKRDNYIFLDIVLTKNTEG